MALADPAAVENALPEELQQLAIHSGFASSTRDIVSANQFLFGRGYRADPQLPRTAVFEVTGKELAYVSSSDSSSIKMHSPSQFEVRLGDVRASSIALRFEDGSGCLLPSIRDFEANVLVGEHGVTNVSYRPRDYEALPQSVLSQLNLLHATAATATKYGVFRVDGPRQASLLGSTVRMGKMYDFTLGVYAAYAYAGGGFFDDVKSVEFALRSEYGLTFFDVSMLAGSLSGHVMASKTDENSAPLPGCPILKQGWSLLRATNIKVIPELEEAATHTLPSLWTTYDAHGMDVIERFFGFRRVEKLG